MKLKTIFYTDMEKASNWYDNILTYGEVRELIAKYDVTTPVSDADVLRMWREECSTNLCHE